MTAQLLRRVQVGSYLTDAQKILSEMRQRDDAYTQHVPDYHGDPIWRMARAQGFTGERPEKKGRKGHPDTFYAQLARDYVAAIEAGSRRPAKDVARRRRLSPARVRDMLHEARHRGLLTPASMPGRRGLAALTDRGNAVLAGELPKNAPAAAQPGKKPKRARR